VLDARGGDVRAQLEAFRRFAALDEIDMKPVAPGGEDDGGGPGLFPAPDDAPLVLANVHGITLHRSGDTWQLTAADVDNTVRPSHVATRTIQELLCGRCDGGGGGAPLMGAAAPGNPSAEAGGPRVDRGTVALAARTLTMTVDKPLDTATVDPEAFRVSALGESGWKHIKVTSAAFDEASRVVTVKLRTDPGENVVRIIAFGTGINPLLGADFVPLAGAKGGPPATEHEGIDFVHMLKRS
jgi:hypothetical protein